MRCQDPNSLVIFVSEMSEKKKNVKISHRTCSVFFTALKHSRSRGQKQKQDANKIIKNNRDQDQKIDKTVPLGKAPWAFFVPTFPQLIWGLPTLGGLKYHHQFSKQIYAST